jgi:phosphodiesterase/alkaline phosphatase D-like protein
MQSPNRRKFLQLGAGLFATGCAGGAAGTSNKRGPPDDSGGPNAQDTGDDTGDPGEDTGEPTVRPVEPAPYTPDGTIDRSRFPTGVQVTDAEDQRALVNVVVNETEPITLRIFEARGESWEEVQTIGDLLPIEGEERVLVDVGGLSPDTAYTVVFETAGGSFSAPARFRTLLSGLRRPLVFGLTSCLGGNEPWPSLSVAASERLDGFFLLGDTVYADGAVSKDDYRFFWRAAFRTQGLVDLSASTGLYATWDDHEVDNNWSHAVVDEAWYTAARDAMHEQLPWRPGTGGSGIWRSFRWGDVAEVFVLDCRGERRDGLYISVEQMEWLKAGLAASTAHFKLILNSVPITDLTAIFGAVLAEDRWDGYPDQREEILGFIEDEGLSGVLWLTGDVHYPQVGFIDPEGGLAAERVEVFCGPAGSFINPAATLFVGAEQYTWLGDQWNWVRLTLDADTGVARVEFVLDDGSVLYATDLEP